MLAFPDITEKLRVFVQNFHRRSRWVLPISAKSIIQGFGEVSPSTFCQCFLYASMSEDSDKITALFHPQVRCTAFLGFVSMANLDQIICLPRAHPMPRSRFVGFMHLPSAVTFLSLAGLCHSDSLFVLGAINALRQDNKKKRKKGAEDIAAFL